MGRALTLLALAELRAAQGCRADADGPRHRATTLRSLLRIMIAVRFINTTRTIRSRVVAKTMGLAASESGDWKPRS